MNFKGIYYVLLSTFCFSLVNFQVKELPGIPAHEIVFFRSLVTFIITAAFITYRKIPFFGNEKKWLFVRGFAGAGSLILFFTTLKEMPLASATTIQYLSPIFTVLLATQMNNDRIKTIQWFLFVLSFTGIVLIKGYDARVSYIMLALGIASSFLSGVAYNAIVKCRDTENPLSLVLYFPLVALPITGIWCLFEWKTPQGYDWLILLNMGILTQIAQVSLTRALHLEKSSIVIPFVYLGIVYALILGYVFQGETFGWQSLLGIFIVVAGVILNTIIGSKGVSKAA
ncbi:MAG: DMT family transporter [Flavobacteriales bacterium]